MNYESVMVSPSPDITVKTIWGTFRTLDPIVLSLLSKTTVVDPAVNEALGIPDVNHHDKFGTVVGFVTLPHAPQVLTPVIRVGQTLTTMEDLLKDSSHYIAGLIKSQATWDAEQEGLPDGTPQLQPQEEETKEQEA